MKIPADLLEKIKENDSRITEINLTGLGINSEDIENLAKVLVGNQHIKKLILDNNYIADDGVIILAQCLAKTKIESISLANNYISDKGAIALLQTSISSTVIEYNFSDNFLGREFAEYLPKYVKANPRLNRINVGHNKFTDVDISFLHRKITQQDRLKILGIDQPHILTMSYAKILATQATQAAQQQKKEQARSIADFTGDSLVVGCGRAYKHETIHPSSSFYHIDFTAAVKPDLVCDFRQPIAKEIIPDHRFSFIYFECIDANVFIGDPNSRSGQDIRWERGTFSNIKRLLKPDGICAIMIGDNSYVFKKWGKSVLADIFVPYGFVSGKLAPLSNNQGGVLLVSQQPINAESISKLNIYAQRIINSIWFKRDLEYFPKHLLYALNGPSMTSVSTSSTSVPHFQSTSSHSSSTTLSSSADLQKPFPFALAEESCCLLTRVNNNYY